MQIKKIVLLLVLLAVVGAAVTGFRWQQQANDQETYRSNGRLEARQSQVASRLPGTLVAMPVHEGDRVTQGQLLATLDSQPLQADIVKAEAAVQQGRDQLQLVQAQLVQQESECTYAHNQLQRMQSLSRKQNVSVEQLDNARMHSDSCKAGIIASQAQIAATASALKMAEAGSARLRVDLEDMSISAPFSGFVLYRLAEPGEVIGPGGRLLTLVSDTDIYLTVFLPSEWAGQLVIGDKTTLIMDAHPELPVPASVSFIAPEAQFTPKTVETTSERSKLMFRVKLNIEPDFLQENAWLKIGMPGEVRLKPVGAKP